jgi:hypothetical protein
VEQVIIIWIVTVYTLRVPLIGVNRCRVRYCDARKEAKFPGTVTTVSVRVQSFVWQIAAFKRRSPSELTLCVVRVLDAEWTTAYEITSNNTNPDVNDVGGDDDDIVSQYTAPLNSSQELSTSLVCETTILEQKSRRLRFSCFPSSVRSFRARPAFPTLLWKKSTVTEPCDCCVLCAARSGRRRCRESFIASLFFACPRNWYYYY